MAVAVGVAVVMGVVLAVAMGVAEAGDRAMRHPEFNSFRSSSYTISIGAATSMPPGRSTRSGG
jgi:hypothetical protein